MEIEHLPVLVKPVVSLGLGVERIAEVAGTGRSNPVVGTIGEEEVVDELLVASLIILLHDAEVSHAGS